jgi:hypothetical protein
MMRRDLDMNDSQRQCPSLLFLSCIISLTLLAGCERSSAVRRYQEIVVEPEPSSADDPHMFLQNMMLRDDVHANLPAANNQNRDQMLTASVARLPLVWTTPQGWIEQKGDGMRMVSFTSSEQDSLVQCTIVSLEGRAGGVAQNVIRWMRQIQLDAPAGRELEQFIARQERLTTGSGIAVQIIDLTELQEEAGEDAQSMIAGILEFPNAQVFVKMTGSKSAVLKNRDRLKSLIQSIREDK